MAARYEHSFYSLSGDVWKIQIMDSSFSGAVTIFKCEKSGFRISEPSLAQRMDPILASSCTVPFWVETSTHEAFMKEIVRSQEERFGVIVYLNSVIQWRGIIVNDGMEFEDQAYPCLVNLKFIDGLGRLSDKFYNTYGTETSQTPYTGRDTFIEHVIHCLSWAGTVQYFENDSDYIKIVCNYYEARHTSLSNCPLKYSNIDHKIFYEYDDQGMITYKTVSEVLAMILQTFNLRIFMASGTYHVVQTQEYTNLYKRSWLVRKTGTVEAAVYPDSGYILNTSSFSRLAGGVTKYLPPLNTIKKKYKYKYSSGDSGNLIPVQFNYDTAVDFINGLQSGNNEALHFSGDIQESYAGWDPMPGHTFWAVYKFQVILTNGVTTYYLSNTSGGAWSTNPATIFYLNGKYFNSSASGNFISQYDFITAAIPINGTATFQFTLDHFANDMADPGSPPGSTFTSTCENFCMQIESVSLQLEGEKDFFVFNGASPKSTQKLELKETLIGDGPFAYSLGRIETYNGSTWAKSHDWKRGAIPAVNMGLDINQLSINENILGQQEATEVFQGSFAGSGLRIEKALNWNSKIMVPLQIDTFPAEDKVTGRWFNAVIPAF